ncbi:DUF2690 domain-containing protein [Streptomyces sp. NPDC002668]|uniref:DUF2690 domain-containing protein n=1 Tax=Streptomyces sp. NPDC002668 TaxID=3154422 RepID=UPI00332DA323
MGSRMKLTSRLLLVMATVIGSLALTAGPANAASCYGSSCKGRNPQTAGCGADAVTLHSVTTPYGIRVELRWSETCGAAWGRILNAWPGDLVIVEGSGYVTYQATVKTGHDAFTAMVDDRYPRTARACGGANTRDLRCTLYV